MRSFIKNRLGDYAYPIIIAIVALIIVGIIAGVVYSKRDKVEAQRTAKIVEVNGPCTVMREGALLNAVADMPLYSGDTFYSGIDASARIMIDDDKFLYLDPTTRINFTASGTPEETHTLIYVETGSMLTEVKEKLADGESFDIVTPNSFMEIHGTKTLTQVVADAEGNIETSSAVLQGNVRFVTVVMVDGKILYADENMTAGQSRGVGSARISLPSAEELMQIVTTGQSLDGKLLLHASYEELDVVVSDGDFDSGLLDRVTVVILKSQQEDVAAGGNVIDTDGDGISDTINNVDALRDNDDDSKVGDAGNNKPQDQNEETEEEKAAREAAAAAAQEEADKAAQEEADRKAAEQAAAEAQQLSAEEFAQQMKELEAALAQVAANNQAIADAEAEAARQAAQQADQGDDSPPTDPGPSSPSASPTEPSSTDPSDPSTTDPTDPSTSDPSDPSSTTLQEGDPDPIGGGTFTGGYTADGYPVYVNSDETMYYLEEPNPDGIVPYDDELYPAPSTDP